MPVPRNKIGNSDSELVHWCVRERRKRKFRNRTLSTPLKGSKQSMSISIKEPGIKNSEELGHKTIKNFLPSKLQTASISLQFSQCCFTEYDETLTNSENGLIEDHQKVLSKPTLLKNERNQEQLSSCLEWSMSTRRLPIPSIGTRCPEL